MEPQQQLQLSENGILYLSSGFTGPYIFQIIACRATGPTSYQLCLTDGQLYIGGNYVSSVGVDLPIYSVVRAECKFYSRWRPIQINKLQVISDKINYLIGKAPATLHDYFLENKQTNLTLSQQSKSDKSQISSISEGESKNQLSGESKQSQKEGALTKRSKLNIEPQERSVCQVQSSSQQALHIQTQTQTQTQKIPVNVPCKNQQPIQRAKTYHIKSSQQSSQIISQVSQISSLPSPSRSKNQKQQKLQFPHTTTTSTTNSNTTVKYQPQTKNLLLSKQTRNTNPQSRIYVAEEKQILLPKQLVTNQTHNVHICDLYERMLRWKILCRVTHLRTFLSARGKKCTVFHLIDQKGDTIKGVYYYSKNLSNPTSHTLSQGKIYSFSGGQITQAKNPSASNTDVAGLQIILDSKSEIKQFTQVFLFPYSSKKLTQYQHLKQSPQKQINLIGIIKSLQTIRNFDFQPTQSQPSYINSSELQTSDRSKSKIKCLICNPIQKYQIEFNKILYAGEKEPIVGRIYVLVNFVVAEIENAIRLSSSANSYFVLISEEDIDYTGALNYEQSKQLKKLKQYLPPSSKSYSTLPYTNLSKIKYTNRLISQLKSIIKQTQTPIYSQILISIIDIKIKKQYKACPICKKSTIMQQHTLYQCLKCKKIVDPIPTVIVNVVVADDTGSFQMDVFGEKVDVIIGVDSVEFCNLSQEDKECTLQISKFSQFVIKVKTEKKGFKQVVHSLQEVQKQQHTLSMKEIRRRTVEKKLKLEDKWSENDM